MEVPFRLMFWAKETEAILAKKSFPPDVEPDPKKIPQWEKFSNWALLCEEILDTTPDLPFLQMAYDELRRRGLSDDLIQGMRRFAWLTAGWLNYKKCLWEWVHLDEKDIEAAIDWQRKDGLITNQTREEMLLFMREHCGPPTSIRS